MAGGSPPRGIRIGPGIGKGRFRIRQSLVANEYASLIAGKSCGAVKLDILLRCIALPPKYAGGRPPGYVLHSWRYEDLHDLVKTNPPRKVNSRSEQATTKLKRKWVANQLRKLEDLDLVKVTARPGHTPRLTVLRDDRSGELYDDPWDADRFEPFFTIHGSLIASGELSNWGAAEVAAYFACLLAELHHDRGGDRRIRPGQETWWRPLAWFRNDQWDPPRRTLLPFSTSLLEEGMRNLEGRGMISIKRVTRSPRDGRRLPRPRNVYRDHFNKFDRQDYELEDLLEAVAAEDAAAGAQNPPSVADAAIENLPKAQAG